MIAFLFFAVLPNSDHKIIMPAHDDMDLCDLENSVVLCMDIAGEKKKRKRASTGRAATQRCLSPFEQLGPPAGRATGPRVVGTGLH